MPADFRADAPKAPDQASAGHQINRRLAGWRVGRCQETGTRASGRTARMMTSAIVKDAESFEVKR